MKDWQNVALIWSIAVCKWYLPRSVSLDERSQLPPFPSSLLPFILSLFLSPSQDMLRSMTSPKDAHDDHLRHLLDQRNTRAAVHGRFPSLSECSDSPSIYSRGFFSPRSTDRHDIDTQSLDVRFRSPPTSAFDGRSHHDRMNDPAASMLDLDDDPRSSYAPSDAYDDRDEEEQLEDEDDEESLPRMSLLGPKMRFHSRAPWEMDENALEEEDESENGQSNYGVEKHSARAKDSSLKKTFGFGSSSPRVSSSSRPSGESVRSQEKSKRSFESTTSRISYPRGAL